MATKSLSQPLLFKRAVTDAIDSYVGSPNEPILDMRAGIPKLRIMDGSHPGGHLMGELIAGVSPPYITSPSYGASGVAAQPIIIASSFNGVNHSSQVDTHNASYWQISENPDMSAPVYDSNWQVDHLTQLDCSAAGITLQADTVYYVRVKYRGQSGLESSWSPISTFLVEVTLPLLEAGTILANDGVSGDDFGYSLATTTDGGVVVVGSYLDDDRGSNSGSVYVYRRQGNALSLEAKLHGNDITSDNRFGNAVAISGDGQTIAAAASRNDGVKGAVYIFTYQNGTWTETQKLTASNAGSWDQFGLSMELSADGNWLVVGAIYEDTEGYNAGSLYVFQKTNGIFTEQTQLTNPIDAESNDQLGYAVTISGDGSTCAASTIRKGVSGNYIGAVYVFERINGTYYYQAKLTASDGVSGDYFGYHLSLDYAGNTLAASATGDDDNGTNSGAVYIFRKNAGTWSQSSKITPTDGVAYDQFGYRVSLSDDGSLLVVGAPFHDLMGEDTGGAYLFQYTLGTWQQITKYTAGDASPTDALGQAIDISGDGSKVYIGSYRRNSYTGQVYLFS